MFQTLAQHQRCWALPWLDWRLSDGSSAKLQILKASIVQKTRSLRDLFFQPGNLRLLHEIDVSQKV
jgi:hypothetical protein